MNFGYNLLTDRKLSTLAKTFSIFTDRTVSDVRVEWVISCHRMAHCVLIRCFLQPSLAEALPWCHLR